MTRALRRCQVVGRGARVRGRPMVENFGRIEIGRDLTLSAHPVPVHLATAPAGTLAIGDRVSIAHGVGIAAHADVRIGDDAVIGPYAMILDTDFHVPGDRHARPECTPIRVGRGVHVGAHVTVLRGAVIGDGAVIEPGSVVGGGVPAGARVAGVPTRPVADDDGGAPLGITPEDVLHVRRVADLVTVLDARAAGAGSGT